MIQFPCPSCGADLKLPDQYAGKKGKCPSCKEVVTVPDASPASDGGSWWDAPGNTEAQPEQPVERPRKAQPRDDDDAEQENVTNVVVRNNAGRSPGQPGDGMGIVRILGWTLLIGAIWGFIDLMFLASLILFGGAITFGLGFICCFNPGFLYAIVVYVLCLIRSINLLSGKPGTSSPKIFCILQMILLITLDFVNFALGLVGLMIASLPEVRQYYPARDTRADRSHRDDEESDVEDRKVRRKSRHREEEDDDQ